MTLEACAVTVVPHRLFRCKSLQGRVRRVKSHPHHNNRPSCTQGCSGIHTHVPLIRSVFSHLSGQSLGRLGGIRGRSRHLFEMQAWDLLELGDELRSSAVVLWNFVADDTHSQVLEPVGGEDVNILQSPRQTQSNYSLAQSSVTASPTISTKRETVSSSLTSICLSTRKYLRSGPSLSQPPGIPNASTWRGRHRIVASRRTRA